VKSRPNQHQSKEAAALSSLDVKSLALPQRRRVRRRRRSLRRRLIDGMMPLCILTGLTVFAGGLVQVVEIGAAGQSKAASNVVAEPLEVVARPEPSFDYQGAQDAYRDMMRQNAAARRNTQRPAAMNQAAYQLSLQMEAQRELTESFATLEPKTPSAVGEIDWSLLEPGSEDPRSTLQRGLAPCVRPHQATTGKSRSAL
jgi:hypothetical protein